MMVKDCRREPGARARKCPATPGVFESSKVCSIGRCCTAAKAGWTAAAAEDFRHRAVMLTASHNGGTIAVARKISRRGGSVDNCNPTPSGRLPMAMS